MSKKNGYSDLNRYPKPRPMILNTLGFPKYDTGFSKKMAFIGCSYTFGSGINIEDTWGVKLAKFLKSSYHNFSLPGATLEDCILLLQYAQELNNYEHVFFLLPPEHRVLYLLEYEERPYFVYSTDTNRLFPHRTNLYYFKKPTYSKSYTGKLLKIQQEILRQSKSKVSMLYWYKPVGKIKIETSPKSYYNKKISNYEIAYDGIHAGPRWHTYVKNKMLEVYEKDIQENF